MKRIFYNREECKGCEEPKSSHSLFAPFASFAVIKTNHYFEQKKTKETKKTIRNAFFIPFALFCSIITSL
jgi:hypothetical protein